MRVLRQKFRFESERGIGLVALQYSSATLAAATPEPGATSEWPGLPKVSRQVLGDVRGHLEHIEARHREDGLERRVRLDGAAVVQRVLLDVSPDGLGYFGARHLALTADRRQRRAERLRSEDTHALLLHGSRHLLAVCLRRRLASGFLRRLDRRLRRLRDRRLLRGRGRTH